MVISNFDKQALKENSYTVLSKITIVGTDTVFTEEDAIVDWNYEDYRYVPGTGFIGQFVERILDGNLQNISEDVILEDKEINLKIGIVNGLNEQTTWYDYGNFLITNVSETDTTGNFKFESCDYTKKFNTIYEDNISYPTISLALANDVCSQANVELQPDGYCHFYVIPKDGLTAGNYNFYYNGTYYNFTLSNNLNFYDTLMYVENTETLTLKTVDSSFNVTRTNLEVTVDSSATGTTLVFTRTPYVDFTNNDFVIENNQYESEDTLRKVMQDIGKLAYSWVRVAEDNKVYIDFEQKSEESVDTFDELSTDEYYTSKKSDLYFGPVNKVLIGMKDVEGENLYKTSDDYTEETECSLKIFDNDLTYTDELRAIALNGCEKLFGLKYMPLQIETIGHPWLEGNELIKLTNVDEEELYTYPFNRQIKYAGYIEGVIGAEAQTSQETEYEYTKDIISDVKKTRFIVDKDNQRIDSLIERTEGSESRITELEQTTEGITATVEHLNDEYEQNVVIKKTADGNPIEVEDAGHYQLNDFKIYGNTEQDGTPTPTNPVDVQTITSKGNTTHFEGDNFEVQNDYDESLELVERSNMEFSGNTSQVQYTGKNKAPFTNQDFTLNSVHYFVQDGSLYFNGTSTGETSSIDTTFKTNLSFTLPSGTYTISHKTGIMACYLYKTDNTLVKQVNTNVASETFTLSEETQVFLGFYVYQKTFNNLNSEIMISPSGGEYEPYVGGTASPNPNYPQDIHVVSGDNEIKINGANPLDNSKIVKGRLDNGVIGYESGTTALTTTTNSVSFTTNTSYRGIVTDYIPIMASSYIYSVYDSADQTIGQALAFYDKDKNFISQLNGGRITNGKRYANNVSNAKYCRIWYYLSSAGTTTITDLQVRFSSGETAPTYEPYVGNIYEINLGKNLFDKSSAPLYYSNNMQYTETDTGCKLKTSSNNTSGFVLIDLGNIKEYENKTLTFSMSNTANALYKYIAFVGCDNTGGNRATIGNALGTSSNTLTTTIGSGYTQTRLTIRLYIEGGTTNTEYELNNIQVEKGNATSYSPYFTPIELNKISTYKDLIFKGKGVNLLDTDQLINGTISQTDGYTITGNSSVKYSPQFIEVKEGSSYTMSCSVSGLAVRYFTYDSNKNYITTGLMPFPWTIPSGVSYIRIQLNQSFISNLMLNEGTTAELYEPYNAKGKWLLHKEIGKTTFDGNAQRLWGVNSVWDTSNPTILHIFSNDLNNIWLKGQSGNFSNRFICTTEAQRDFNKEMITCHTTTTTPYIFISYDRLSGVTSASTVAEKITALNNWLKSNVTDLYFILTTPTTTEITNDNYPELLEQLENINNLEFFDGTNNYTTTSSNLPIQNKFDITNTNYEIVTISDEDNNTLTHRILMKDFELCEIGDYRDYLYFDSGKWYKHKEIGKVVLDGTETGWSYQSNNKRFYRYFSDLKNNGEVNASDTYCNYFTPSDTLNIPYTIVHWSNGLFFYSGDMFSSLSDVITWLGTNKPIVYYVLNTPTNEEITDTIITNTLNEILQSYLYKGYNKIYLHDEIADKIEIIYLTDSILNSTYAAKTQLALTEESLSATVERTTALENNVTSLQLGINGITTEVTSVKDITSDLENSINYLNIELSGNSIIIPTNDENLPYISTTYTIPYTATFKGDTVTPTATTADTATGITVSFATGQIKIGVSTTTAITSLTNTFNINFTYTNEGQTYLVTKAINIGLSVKGEDGKDGTSVTILGSYDTLAQLQAAHPTGNAGDSYMVGDDLYVWSVTASAWVDVGQIKGNDGTSSYVYIRYSENETGNPMTTSPTSTSKYIGVATTDSNSAPTSYTSYTWSQYAGTDGETTYVHVKYSEDGSTFVEATDDAGEGDTPSAWIGVLTDTNEEASTNFEDYTWYKFTEDIDGQLTDLQNSVSENKTNIENNYTAIVEQLDDYAKADVVATLKQTVETNQSDTEYAISVVKDLQVNGVSQVRTEKGFTFNDDGLTIDETNSVTKGIYDTNGVSIIDKTGSSNSEVFFAGYDEETHTSIVRTNNLSVSTYFNIGTKSRFEDYEDGTGVFI